MKHFLLLAPALLGLAACHSSPTTPDLVATAPARPEPAPAAPPPAAPAQQEAEHLENEILTINGKPQQELSTRQLVSELGRPDSIAKGAVECGAMLASLNKLGSPNGDFWYYGKTMYEVSGTQAILVSFDVTTRKFRGQLGKLALNQRTTLEDVRRFFPKAARQADGPATGRPGEEVSLPFYAGGQPTDESLILLFDKGKLQAVEFFMPC